MGKKSELETELAELKEKLNGADTDEIREELSTKISEIETALETATDEEKLEEIESDLERLKTWATQELGAPITALREEMGEIKALIVKLESKLKKARLQEPKPSEEPAPLPEPVQVPASPPESEPPLPPKNERTIMRL